MGPAMLLPYETEIAYRRETMLADFARTRRPVREPRGRSAGALRRLARVRLALTHAHASPHASSHA